MYPAEQLASDLLRRNRFLRREARVGGAKARFNTIGTSCESYARSSRRKRISTTETHRHLHYAVTSLEAYASKDARDPGPFFFFLAKTITVNDLADAIPSSAKWCCSFTKHIPRHQSQQRGMPYVRMPLLEPSPAAFLRASTTCPNDKVH